MNRIPTQLHLDLQDAQQDRGSSASSGSAVAPNWMQRFSRNRVFGAIESFTSGSLTVEDFAGQISISNANFRELQATVMVDSPEFYRRLVTGGIIAAAETYMDGQWRCDDLTALIRIMIRNLSKMKKVEKGLSKFSRVIDYVYGQFRRNTKEGSRRNIHEHYDLGNEFFRLFLDRSMNYSSGIFPAETMQSGLAFKCESKEDSSAMMLEASLNKMRHICEKLDLNVDDHLIEIGTGWGALSIFAAQNFGCKVTTTTISEEQFALATERVKQAGLEDRVTVLQRDYRDLEGKFTKLVSVEMIEAVGHQYFDIFFETCNRLLTDDGTMLLQVITMNENDYPEHLKGVDFIRKHIFPGGCLPAVSAMTTAAANTSRMRMMHLEDITEHYVLTLQHWRRMFDDSLEEVRGQGFSESFIRKWIFYLCYCEAAFAERRIGTCQIMFAKSESRLDPMDLPKTPKKQGRNVRLDLGESVKEAEIRAASNKCETTELERVKS